MNLQEYKDCLNQIKEEDLFKLKDLINSHQNIVILGNGGSSAIASHRALDYTNALSKDARTLDSGSMLSCYANDFTWEETYLRFLKKVAKPDSLVILISSSGNSMNIVKCAEYCDQQNIAMIVLSGFDAGNKLQSLYASTGKAKLGFYVASRDYGVVECLHDFILHSVV